MFECLDKGLDLSPKGLQLLQALPVDVVWRIPLYPRLPWLSPSKHNTEASPRETNVVLAALPLLEDGAVFRRLHEFTGGPRKGIADYVMNNGIFRHQVYANLESSKGVGGVQSRQRGQQAGPFHGCDQT